MPAPARTLVLLNSRYPVQRHTIPLWPASYFRHLRNATMKLKHSTALAMACLWLGFTPAWAVNKDIVQLQTQMQDLQQQMSRMQQSFDERMGIMKNLLDQNTDSINKATSAISNIQNALRDYNAAKYDLASQEFTDYIKYYPNTDLAGNSHFYLADIEFREGKYQQAVKDYDQVLQNFPDGNKAAAAELKKGFALIELG